MRCTQVTAPVFWVFWSRFTYPLHWEMSIQERECKFSRTMIMTEHWAYKDENLSPYFSPGPWLCALLLWNQKGGENSFPFLKSRTASLSCLLIRTHPISKPRREVLQATMGDASWASGMLLRMWNFYQVWNVVHQGMGLFHHKHKPYIPSFIWHLSSLSALPGAKSGMWFVLG